MNDDDIKQVVENRISEIHALTNLLQMWPILNSELERQKKQLIDNLVMQDNEQTRGRIKQINDFMDLPTALRMELRGLEETLPD